MNPGDNPLAAPLADVLRELRQLQIERAVYRELLSVSLELLGERERQLERARRIGASRCQERQVRQEMA